MTLDDRFRYYLGDFFGEKLTLAVPDKYRVFKRNQIYHYLGPNNYPMDYRLTPNRKDNGVRPAWWWGNNKGFAIDFPCLVNSADGTGSDGLPTLTMARILGKERNGILYKACYGYCWGALERFQDPFRWEEKENLPVWRGVSTTGNHRKYTRRHFVEKYYAKYNVGFGPLHDPAKQCTHPGQKGALSIVEQLKYKYLVCLEGNDVATSLKWSLLSNSIVLMSKPTCESWLMEGLLEPFVHYVPLNEDFGNLPEMLEWCIQNDAACAQISENATRWMQPFLDHDAELKLHNQIKSWYLDNVALTF